MTTAWTTFQAVPVLRGRGPAKAFGNARDALHYARTAAASWGVGYAVWRVHGGRIRLLKRMEARTSRLVA